ncbi:MAG TPA: serine/threonine-protein kinase [Vicinamibacterales bacterium]|jgi:serine/threonine-protein kinase
MLEAIGQYRILEWVGAGGLGETCRARDTRHGRTVALTVVNDELIADADRRRRFLADAERAAALSHPNIAALYEFGDEDGMIYLAKEYVPGQSLGAIVGGHPLNTRRALSYATQIADALAEAHASGMLHGDIRADHIVITTKGNAKIPDFGFAQWVGRGSVADEAGDLRALGAVLFHMLTGKPPVAGWPAPPPSTINRNLPKEIDAVVGQLLTAGTGDSLHSAAAAAAELRSLSAVLDTRAKRTESKTVEVAQTQRSSKRGLILVVLAIVIAVGLIWIAARP